MSAFPNHSPARSLVVFSLLEQAEFWAAERQLNRAWDLYHQAVTRDTTSLARLRFGEFLYQNDQSQEALTELTEALEMARRQENVHHRAEACRLMATLYHEQGETALATSYRQQEIAARLAYQTQHPAESALPTDFLTLANEALSRGDLVYAAQLVEHSLKFAQSQNCVRDLADAWGMWGNIQFLKSNGTTAWRALRKAYFFHCQVGNETGRAVDLLNLAQVARQNGWWLLTYRLLTKAQKIVQSSGLVELKEKIDRFLEEANRVLSVADRTPEWN